MWQVFRPDHKAASFSWRNSYSHYYQQTPPNATPQPLPLIEAMANLIEHEMKERACEDIEGRMNELSQGAFFDMGHFSIGFGLVVENEYYGVYRLWSRAIFYSK